MSHSQRPGSRQSGLRACELPAWLASRERQRQTRANSRANSATRSGEIRRSSPRKAAFAINQASKERSGVKARRNFCDARGARTAQGRRQGVGAAHDVPNGMYRGCVGNKLQDRIALANPSREGTARRSAARPTIARQGAYRSGSLVLGCLERLGRAGLGAVSMRHRPYRRAFSRSPKCRQVAPGQGQHANRTLCDVQGVPPVTARRANLVRSSIEAAVPRTRSQQLTMTPMLSKVMK